MDQLWLTTLRWKFSFNMEVWLLTDPMNHKCTEVGRGGATVRRTCWKTKPSMFITLEKVTKPLLRLFELRWTRMGASAEPTRGHLCCQHESRASCKRHSDLLTFSVLLHQHSHIKDHICRAACSGSSLYLPVVTAALHVTFGISSAA